MNRTLALLLTLALASALHAAPGPRPLAPAEVEALRPALEKARYLTPQGDRPYLPHDMRKRAATPATAAFVRTLVNPKPVAKALLVTTSRGVGEYYLNGQTFAQETLKPGFTQVETAGCPYIKPRRHLYGYDITPIWHTSQGATNLLSALVTGGWYGDALTCGIGQGRKPQLLQLLQLTYSDGTQETFPSTDAYRAAYAGPILYADIYYGQTQDARIPDTFLSQPAASAHWLPARQSPVQNELLQPVPGAQIYDRYDLALPAQTLTLYQGATGADANQSYGKINIIATPTNTATILPGQTLIADFAQNAAARPSLLIQAPEGTRLTFRFAEMLNDGNGSKARGCDGPEGSLYLANMRSCPSQFDYISNGKTTTVHPTFSFWGYRYLSVTADRPATLSQITSIPVTSLTQAMERGHLRTGNQLVNRLVSNTLWGLRSNYLSVPTDCPQRDERQGWMADTQVFVPTALCFADVSAFLRKYLADIRDCQLPDGQVTSVAPQVGRFASPNRLGWADGAVIIPYTLWRETGDKAPLAEAYDSMKAYVNSIAPSFYATPSNSWQYADWLSFEQWETCRDNYWNGRPAAVGEWWDFLGACYCYRDAEILRQAATALGNRRDAGQWLTLREATRKHLLGRWFTAEGELIEAFRGQQTAHVIALNFGIVPEAARGKVARSLAALIRSNGTRLSTGFLGTSLLLETLSRHGETALAYDLLLQEAFPSWLYSVNQGATTIWERWNSYTKEKGFGPVGMNSFNHYAYGSVVSWLFGTAGGIRPVVGGNGKLAVLLAPEPDRRLGHLEAVRAVGGGLVRSAWSYEGATWKWSFTVPEGLRAAVRLPGESIVRAYKPGTYTIEKKLP